MYSTNTYRELNSAKNPTASGDKIIVKINLVPIITIYSLVEKIGISKIIRNKCIVSTVQYSVKEKECGSIRSYNVDFS